MKYFYCEFKYTKMNGKTEFLKFWQKGEKVIDALKEATKFIRNFDGKIIHFYEENN